MIQASSLAVDTKHAIMRILPWALKVFVSVGLIWYLLDKVNLAEAFSRGRALPAPNLIGAFCLILLQAVLGGVRWRFVVDAIGAHLSTATAVVITFVSLFFSQFLPASVGADLVRMLQSRRAGLTVPAAVTSVVLERVGNLLCVVAMALATSPLWLTHVKDNSAYPAAIYLGLGAVVVLASLMLLDRLPARWRVLRVVRALAALARDTRLLFFHPRYASLFILTAVAGQFALAAAVLVLAEGLNLHVRLIDCIVLMPPVVLLSSLPISVAGWGVREFAMVGAFAVIGVPAESALALSLTLAIVAVLVSLIGGVLWGGSRFGLKGAVLPLNRTP